MAVLAHDEDVDVAAHGDSVAVAEALLGAATERQRKPSCRQPNRGRGGDGWGGPASMRGCCGGRLLRLWGGVISTEVTLFWEPRDIGMDVSSVPFRLFGRLVGWSVGRLVGGVGPTFDHFVAEDGGADGVHDLCEQVGAELGDVRDDASQLVRRKLLFVGRRDRGRTLFGL